MSETVQFFVGRAPFRSYGKRNEFSILKLSDTLSVVIYKSNFKTPSKWALKAQPGKYLNETSPVELMNIKEQFEKDVYPIIATIGDRLPGVPKIVHMDEAEFHVFESMVAKTGEKVWQFFYQDEKGKNRHSEHFLSKDIAINEYNKRFAPAGIWTDEDIKEAFNTGFGLGKSSREEINVDTFLNNFLHKLKSRVLFNEVSLEIYFDTLSDSYRLVIDEDKKDGSIAHSHGPIIYSQYKHNRDEI